MLSKTTVITNLIVFFSTIIIVVSCNSDVKKNSDQWIVDRNEVILKYAKGFEIQIREGFKIITLKDAWKGEKTTYQYVLYKDIKPEGYENAIFIKIPITRIACMSVTHVALLEKLNQLNSVVALSGRDNATSIIIKENVKKGKIKEAGNFQKLNYEVLVEESPDVVMTFGVDQTSNTNINKLKELGLNVVLNAEYMELHPLGKLEWIKFMAAFYDKEKEANQIFDEIEKEYLALAGLTKNVKQKPSVFVGMPWNGVWHVAGGKSFVAKLFVDAGADYLWSDNNEKGGYSKGKEVILDEALETEFWLNLNSYESLESIASYDERFKYFSAFKQKKLFNNNKRLSGSGNNEYWETGIVNPHIILKDLIEIFHPDILDHELYYYQELE
jgi:iron complex transport system substrate-binding protein